MGVDGHKAKLQMGVNIGLMSAKVRPWSAWISDIAGNRRNSRPGGSNVSTNTTWAVLPRHWQTCKNDHLFYGESNNNWVQWHSFLKWFYPDCEPDLAVPLRRSKRRLYADDRHIWGGVCVGECEGLMAGTLQSTHSYSLGQLHLYLLADFLPLLVAADGEDVTVLQLLLAGPVAKLHSQQLLPHPAWEGPCCCQGQRSVRVTPRCSRQGTLFCS